MSDLWHKYQNQYKQRMQSSNLPLIKDGPVNEKKYHNSNPKILFILKEVNDWKTGDDLQLKEVMFDDYKNPTYVKYLIWNNVARWALGIFNSKKSGGFVPIEEVDNNNDKIEALSKIAVINLKKISGTNISDMNVINAYSSHDRDLLVEQVEKLAPKIIIAGGTFNQLTWLLDLKIDLVNPCGNLGYDKSQNIIVIPMHHPSKPGKNVTSYQLLEKFYKTSSSNFLFRNNLTY